MKSPIMSRGQKSNSADQSIPVSRELPTGERSSRGSNGHANGTNGARKKKEPKDPTILDRKQLLEALLAFKKGNFAVRLPINLEGVDGKIADAFNEVIERNEKMSRELERLGRVVGWCHAAPKTELLNIEGDKDPAVGAIVCFVVAPDQRRQGVATRLLDAAIEHLRKRGMRTAEAYPRLGESDPSHGAQAMYVGPLSMYVKAGFAIEEQHEDFAVVRKAL